MPKDTWRRKPEGPAYIVGVTDFVHRIEPPRLTSRAAMYRCVLQHLRLLPDPIIWAHVAPAMRKLCASYKKKAGDDGGAEAGPELEAREAARAKEEKRRTKTLDEAKGILGQVRAAVAAHPHALNRLIRRAYKQAGPDKWEMYRNVERTSSRSPEIRKHEKHLGAGQPPVPEPLVPLVRPAGLPTPKGGSNDGENLSQRKARLQWLREHETLQIPLRFPKNTGVVTGVEDQGAIETVQAFARVAEEYARLGEPRGPDPISHHTERETPTEKALTMYPLPRTHDLPSFDKLPVVLQRIFPRKLSPTMREPPMPKPPRFQTKTNPNTWKNPVRLTPRLLTRMYQRLWDSLVWVRPKTHDVHGPWVKCHYESMLLYEQGRLDESSELDRTRTMSLASRSRLSPMSARESEWVKRHRLRREAKEAVDRLLSHKTPQ